MSTPLQPPYDVRGGAAGVQALLAALYPCPASPSGRHLVYTLGGPCAQCKVVPGGRREPREAAGTGVAPVPGSVAGRSSALVLPRLAAVAPPTAKDVA